MLLDPQAGILVQGITGREASAMVEDARAYGSNIVAGVTPGKGGQQVHGVPVYDTVREAVRQQHPTVTVISVPAAAVLDAALGTIGGRVDNVRRSSMPGHVAMLSRSGGMTTEIASFLTSRAIGQSIAIGVGGDPMIGSNFTELIEL